MYDNFTRLLKFKTAVKLTGYIRVYDRKCCINVKVMRFWLSSHPQLTLIVISILRTELGPCHRPAAVPPGEQCLLCSPQDLLGYNCSTNVIVNFNRLWLGSQFLLHNDSNSSWEYWNGAAVWLSVSPHGFYWRRGTRHPCFFICSPVGLRSTCGEDVHTWFVNMC